MNKVELEARVASLTDEYNFLRSLYDVVRKCLLKAIRKFTVFFAGITLTHTSKQGVILDIGFHL